MSATNQKHHKTNPSTLQSRLNCDKCSRSYATLSGLSNHKCSELAVLKPEFICDYCIYKTNVKGNFLRHVTSRHIQMPQTRNYCDKYFRSYTLSDLKTYPSFEQTIFQTQFICNFCEYTSNTKSSLAKHITSHHTPMSKTRQKMHSCNKCSRSYTSLGGLTRHRRLSHAKVKPQFICDFCGYKSNQKGNLSKHITALHLQTSKQRHYCTDCPRSYTWLSALTRHIRLEHASVTPHFSCDFCEYETNLKSSLSKHIGIRHMN
ncbi:zinc finger protein 778-like [Belonocnema kinseyi]|uniref:zinc finger protein 778-like n=1 Tax=Belonocnema kinseyi TaxID=2817044 RepID=UPI00143CCF5C|nr:zinc finger protein 778-like [Belonocnema kinseyi]